MDQMTFQGKPVAKRIVFIMVLAFVSFVFFLLLLFSQKTMYGYQALFFEIDEAGHVIMLVFSGIMTAFFIFTAFWMKRQALISLTLSPEKLIVKRSMKTIEIMISDIKNLVSVNNRTRVGGIKVAESQSIRIKTDNTFLEINEKQLNGFSRFESLLKKFATLGPDAAGETPSVWICKKCAETNTKSTWSCKSCGTDR